MARDRSAALKKLVERNLVCDKSLKGSRRKKISSSERKARRSRREHNKGNLSATPGNIASQVTKPVARSAEATEIANLKNDIVRELETKATYVKRQYKANVPLTWEGLTPGLAPVGYDPDESDSDEDPY